MKIIELIVWSSVKLSEFTEAQTKISIEAQRTRAIRRTHELQSLYKKNYPHLRLYTLPRDPCETVNIFNWWSLIDHKFNIAIDFGYYEAFKTQWGNLRLLCRYDPLLRQPLLSNQQDDTRGSKEGNNCVVENHSSLFQALNSTSSSYLRNYLRSKSILNVDWWTGPR